MKKKDIICFSIYKILLDILFIKGTSVQFAYLNRILDFNLSKYIFGWLIFIVIIVLIDKIKNENFRFMIKSIFMISGVSNISIFGLRNYNIKYFAIVLLFWLLIIALCIIFSKNKKISNIDNKDNILDSETSNHFNSLLLIIGIMITLYEVYKFGINVTSFSQIYHAREIFRAQSISTFDNYLLSWNATVILPWSFLISIKNKKYLRCAFILILALLMFEINGMKTWLLLYAIIISFVFITKRYNLDSSINVILIGLSVIMGLSVIIFSTTKNYELLSLIDRAIILPGEINYYYLDFFSTNQRLYLHESILKFMGSPYTPISSVQISMKYMSAAYYHNATNGLIGDMYGNFGLIGILVYPFMIMICYIVLNNAICRYSKSVRAVILFLLMWLLVNTSFFTWIMTGGFLLYVIILTINKKIFLKIK